MTLRNTKAGLYWVRDVCVIILNFVSNKDRVMQEVGGS